METMERAHEIMGRNFLGVDAAVRRFKISMTDEAAKAFSTIPFTEEEFESAKNDHILVADFGISLLDLRGRVKRGLFSDQDWYDSYRWAKKAESFQWRLIRKGAVPDSFNENWNKQLSLLQANEVVPKVRQMAYAIMLNYLENDEHLFEHVWVRTSDVVSDGGHVVSAISTSMVSMSTTGTTTTAAATSASLPLGSPDRVLVL